MRQDPLDDQGTTIAVHFSGGSEDLGHAADPDPFVKNVISAFAGALVRHRYYIAQARDKFYRQPAGDRDASVVRLGFGQNNFAKHLALLKAIVTLPTYKHLISDGIRALLLILSSTMIFTPSAIMASPKRDDCTSVQFSVDKYSRSLPDLAVLERLSPSMTSYAMSNLYTHLNRVSSEHNSGIYLAIGRARHSESLRLLLSVGRPAHRNERLALALGLLALGEGSRTGTISSALRLGTVSERRIVSQVLSQMKQVRPMMLLKPALGDVDDVVRLAAATRLGRRRSRSIRSVLLDLTKSDNLDVRREAAELLVKWRYRVDDQAISSQPEPMRSQMYVIAATRRSAQMTSSLKQDVLSKDRLRRTASLASMAHIIPFKRFKKHQERLELRYGTDAIPELAMTLALYDEDDGWAMLDKLDADGLERAVSVMVAYIGPGSARAGLSVGHTQRFANRLEAWMRTGILTGTYERRVFESLAVMDLGIALSVARKRLELKDGPGLLAALRIIARGGNASDVPSIIDSLSKVRSPKSRIETLMTAAKLCRY